jgi:hypothetical protein
VGGTAEVADVVADGIGIALGVAIVSLTGRSSRAAMASSRP